MIVAVQQPSAECTTIFTAHLPVQWQYTKPAHTNGGTDTKTVPASKTKGECACNTPNTLILANGAEHKIHLVYISIPSPVQYNVVNKKQKVCAFLKPWYH